MIPVSALSRYRELDEQHPLSQWLWAVLDSFTDSERVLFMRFVSGRSRLPANLADLSQRFQVGAVTRDYVYVLLCLALQVWLKTRLYCGLSVSILLCLYYEEKNCVRSSLRSLC